MPNRSSLKHLAAAVSITGALAVVPTIVYALAWAWLSSL